MTGAHYERAEISPTNKQAQRRAPVKCSLTSDGATLGYALCAYHCCRHCGIFRGTFGFAMNDSEKMADFCGLLSRYAFLIDQAPEYKVGGGKSITSITSAVFCGFEANIFYNIGIT